MRFDFYMPVQFISGENCVQEHATLFSELGKSCLIVTGGNSAKLSGALDDVVAALEKNQIRYTINNQVKPNPLLIDAKEAGDFARNHQIDFIIGIGGGSALDACKAVAVYGSNDMELMAIYEMNWPNPPLPIICVGTTAGTGSEVTTVAVMTPPDGHKRSISSPLCFPRYSFGDYRYTQTLPWNQTLSTALDALCHSVEGYFALRATAYSDLFAISAIQVLLPQLKLLSTPCQPDEISPQQREQLYYASVNAGITISQAGTLYGHSLGYYLTEEHAYPHGYACAIFLSGLLRYQEKNNPQRTDYLCQQLQCSICDLVQLIESLLPKEKITLTPEQMERIVDSYVGNKNFLNTSPCGFTKEQAIAEMMNLFS